MVTPSPSKRPAVDPKHRSGEFSRRTAAGTVRTDVYDGVWVLTLDRPPANAVDLTLVVDLTAAFEKASTNIGCRGIVVTGSGRSFCAGIDTRLVPNYDRRQQGRMLMRINSLVRIAYGCPRPVVAAINGHTIGAGLVLALLCDFRLASDEDMQLGLTEVSAGIPFPAGPLVVVHSELSPPAARRLVLGGNLYSPRDAAMAEIVDEIVDPGVLVSAAVEHARRLAAAPGYTTVKRQLRAEALDKLTALVERGTDPLTTRWV